METSLFEYGIKQESAKWRAHVSFTAHRIYFFERAAAIAALDECRSAPAFQGGQQTANGKLVPPDKIKDIRRVYIADDIYNKHYVGPNADETAKGQAAEAIVEEVLFRHKPGELFAIRPVKTHREQLAGCDVCYFGETIQVKCDYRGGDSHLGGTGNLYIQLEERNPHRKH
jgi:hypothetical protein